MKQIINKLTKKPLKMEDVSLWIIPLPCIQRVMYAPDYRRFLEWMKGQTVPENGVFSWDFERFLLGRNPFRY